MEEDILDTPDYVKIGAAFDTLGTEIPRIKNVEPIRQHRELLDILREVQQSQKDLQQSQKDLQQSQKDLQQNQKAQGETLKSIHKSIQSIETTQRGFHRDLIIRENATTQIRNKTSLAADPTSLLLPLRNPATGETIPNCPTSSAEIYGLSTAEATRILQALQAEPIPTALAAKRSRVLKLFM
jgi:superfamily II RNA helicase